MYGFGAIAGMPSFTPTFASPNFKDPGAAYSAATMAYQKTATDMTRTGFDMLNQQLFDRQRRNRGLWQASVHLNNQIQNKLEGANTANLQDIKDKITSEQGAMIMNMINSGRGNVSVQDNLNRALLSDFGKETTRSNNEFAKLQAGSMERVMGQALQQREHGIDAITGIYGQGLNFLSSMNPTPPDPGMYFQMAQGLAQGRMPGQLPGMPGAGVPYAPTGGFQPSGLFSPSYGSEGGGGGGYSIFDMPSTYSGGGYGFGGGYGAVSGAGIGYNGQYSPSYATSPQDSWSALAGGNYGRSEATGY